MAYTYREAIKTAYKYLQIDKEKVTAIENTNGRGIEYNFAGIRTVIFIYPISCKQNNKQNFFDTRDSGAKERVITWEYAQKNNLRYFCLGFNEEQERYRDYVLSLESDESSISNVSFRKSLETGATGTQVNIPNDFEPQKKFERIRTPKGFYISAIQKDSIIEYLTMFDNRPYMIENKDNLVEDEILEIELDIPYERNRIVFGAPGTGKSFRLKEDCENTISLYGGTFERVTFHPDYSYAQFVGSYKPVMGENEKIRYDFVPGPFMRVYVEAMKSNHQPHILLIEEINRAKVAAVFGDIFQLLDRDDESVSEYEIQASEDVKKYLIKELGGDVDSYKKIKIPNNMFIWATMNSADQGVFPMDTAFKRRWNFEYLGINANEEKISGIGKFVLTGVDEIVEWNRLRKAINAKMSSSEFKINEDKLLGPFFLSKKAIASDENGMIIDKKAFIDAFKSKVIMYLYEDAIKQGKHKFFDGCSDTSKYSAVCDAFDKIGMGIFGPNFKEDFYDKED